MSPSEKNLSSSSPKKHNRILRNCIRWANLMTIPALAFYFWVGLDGHINAHFLLVVLMLIAEARYTRKYWAS